MDTPFYSLNDAARHLHVSATTLKRWEKDGRLPFVVERTAGGHRRYTDSQLDELRQLIRSQRLAPASTPSPVVAPQTAVTIRPARSAFSQGWHDLRSGVLGAFITWAILAPLICLSYYTDSVIPAIIDLRFMLVIPMFCLLVGYCLFTVLAGRVSLTGARCLQACIGGIFAAVAGPAFTYLAIAIMHNIQAI
jgi:hypothetical protein